MSAAIPPLPGVAVTIRPCRAADLSAVVALIADDMLGARREAADGALAAYQAAFADIEADPASEVYVAEVTGRIVGCYQITVIPNLTLQGARRAQIEGVHVAADIRGQGLFLGIELVDAELRPLPEQASYLVNRMKERGILMSLDGPDHNVLKIKPPMVFSKDNALQLIENLGRVLREDFMQL